MRRLIREPLIHFLILGFALFIAYAMIERGKEFSIAGSGEQIIVTAGTIENLATTFGGVWRRPPTTDELKELIDEHVREEILSREAIKLGLDQNDTIIRRRLRQKMEFLSEDFAATTEPTEVELQAYLQEHPDAFRDPTRFTFEHVYLSNDRGKRLEAEAAALLAELKANPPVQTSELGDVFLGAQMFAEESWQSVASQFGQPFADQLKIIAIGEWAGPIHSGFGAHLVQLTARSEGRLLPLDETREQVKRELLADRRRQVNQAFLDALLARYEVKIDWPGTLAASDADAAIKRTALAP